MAKRNLYLNNTPVDKAIDMYLDALSPYMTQSSELVDVLDCLDRVTAKAVFARFNAPLYDSAAMDGIAAISAQTEGARESSPVTLSPGEFIIVDTGDPIRAPFDCVIMAEELEELEDGAVRIRASASAWNYVRPVGEDITRGEVILPSAHRIRPVDIGVLLSGGITQLAVFPQPRVAVYPTGTELVEADCEPKEGDIVESNSRMLEALVSKAGGLVTRYRPLPDQYDTIKSELEKAARQFDMVLVNAGSSAGTEDYTVHVLREIGEVIVHGVAIKPGKPTILAIVNGKPVIGLPGYPVSAYLAYQSFAAPVLSRLSGRTPEHTPMVKAVITRRLVSSLKYREYIRVKLGQVGTRLVASPLARGAGSAMSLVRSDGFCVIDQDSEGVEAGQEVDIVLERDLSELQGTLVSIGSHDLILDIIADLMSQTHSGTHLSSTHTGSMGGLMALKRGEAHLAPTHLLDEKTGCYNVPVLKELFPEKGISLIKGVGRTQGIMVQKGNPLNIKRIEDLHGLRYINRQRGAGTRVLFDYKLAAAGIETTAIHGYDREAATHMAVAAAIQSGSADAGMGVFSAAKAMDLDFIWIGDEEYDFAIPTQFLELNQTSAFIKALTSQTFKKRLAELGGYTTDHCGTILAL